MTATPAKEESGVRAADSIKKAVSGEGHTIGDIVEAMDRWAIDLGTIRVSLWDAAIFLTIAIGLLVATWFVSKGARHLLRRLTRFNVAQRLLAEKLVTIAVWTIAFLLGIDLLGIDLTALAVFSGAFGLAIGFGLQKTFGNLIAGIILLMDRSIKPGDVIAVSDMSGRESFGQIRKIGVRAISVVTRDRKEYLIPNENLMINQVENWSYSSREVRVKIPVGVSYESDIELVEKLLLQATTEARRVLSSPAPTVNLSGFGESTIDFEIRCWITDPEEGIGAVRSEVLKKVWHLFREHGVEIPFPRRDINLRDSAQFQRLVDAIAQRMEKDGDGPEA